MMEGGSVYPKNLRETIERSELKLCRPANVSRTLSTPNYTRRGISNILELVYDALTGYCNLFSMMKQVAS
jgi:hypothetical protein